MTSAEILTLLLSQAVQVAILALLVGGLAGTAARDRSHLAHALWALVLIKAVTPPLWSSPTGIFSWLMQPVAALSASSSPQPESTPLAIDSQLKAIASPLASDGDSAQVTVRVAPIGSGPEDRSASWRNTLMSVTAAKHGGSLRLWSAVACGLWLAGALLGWITLSTRFAFFLCRLRRMPVVDLPEVENIVDRISKRLGLRRRVRVKVIEGEIGPAVLGLFRPTILLPRFMIDGKSVDSIEPLLAHEMIHIRRGDLWWSMLQSVAKCVWWFYPPVWIAARMQAREAEQSCDEETIAGLRCEPAHYARILLEVLEKKHQLHVAPALPGVRPVDVTAKRLERIMRLGQGSCRQTPRWVWLAILLAALFVLPGTGLVTGQEKTAVEGAAQWPKKVLPNPPRISAGDQEDYAVMRLDVDSILKSLTASGLSSQEAETKLLKVLPASVDDSLDRSATLLEQGRQIQLGGDRPRIQIHAGTLYVFDSKNIRDAIVQSVKQYRRYGLDALQIQATLIRIPKAEWNSLDLPWNEDQPQPPLPGRPNVATAIGNSPHLVTANIDPDRARRVIRQVQAGKIIAAPKIRTPNGCEAMIEVGHERLFTVGYQSESNNGHRIRQPVTQPVKEGTLMKLRPELVESNKVRLQLFVEISQLRSVNTAQLSVDDATDPLTVEIPETATTQIETAIEIPLGKTVALGGLLLHDGDVPHQLLCLVECKKVSITGDAEVPTQTIPDASASASPDLPEASPQYPSPLPWTRKPAIDLRSLESRRSKVAPSVPLLGKSATAMTVTGKFDVAGEGDTTLLRGQHLLLAWDDGDQIQSKSCRIGTGRDGKTEAWFQGEVTMSIDGVQLSADEVKIVDATISASGNVTLSKDQLEFTGDQLDWQLGSVINWSGSVRCVSPTVQFTAQSIRWNPRSNKLESQRLSKPAIAAELRR